MPDIVIPLGARMVAFIVLLLFCILLLYAMFGPVGDKLDFFRGFLSFLT